MHGRDFLVIVILYSENSDHVLHPRKIEEQGRTNPSSVPEYNDIVCYTDKIKKSGSRGNALQNFLQREKKITD